MDVHHSVHGRSRKYLNLVSPLRSRCLGKIEALSEGHSVGMEVQTTFKKLIMLMEGR